MLNSLPIQGRNQTKLILLFSFTHCLVSQIAPCYCHFSFPTNPLSHSWKASPKPGDILALLLYLPVAELQNPHSAPGPHHSPLSLVFCPCYPRLFLFCLWLLCNGLVFRDSISQDFLQISCLLSLPVFPKHLHQPPFPSAPSSLAPGGLLHVPIWSCHFPAQSPHDPHHPRDTLPTPWLDVQSHLEPGP